MSSYEINVVKPEDDSSSEFLHYRPASNSLGLDLTAFGETHPSSFPALSIHQSQLPNGSTMQDNNSYGSAAVNDNSSRPALALLDTTLGHSLSRSPNNSGLHSSSISSTSTSSSTIRINDFMYSAHSRGPQQMWGSVGGAHTQSWETSSFGVPSPSPHSAPLYNSPYLGPPSSISSPSSFASSTLVGSHYPTPSPRQDVPPLTPQSSTGMNMGVSIHSSPVNGPLLFSENPVVGRVNNAMEFNSGNMYPQQQVMRYNASAGYGAGMTGVPYSPQTCNPTNIHSAGPAAPPATTDIIQVPQNRYRPHTSSDQRRYVDEVELLKPIFFYVRTADGGPKPGMPLRDALTNKFMLLEDRDETLFNGCGPSISVRLAWPGYQQWSRQIPTRDFKSPPGPITKSKLAKNVAKSIQRFIEEHKEREMEPGSDSRWAVGPDKIGVDDLLLVYMEHVSMGSWQAGLYLNRPLRPIR